MTMTSRERVLKALNHQEADRVPLDLGATRNSGLLVPTYKELVHYLDLTDSITGSPEHGHSKLLGLATPSEEILNKLAK